MSEDFLLHINYVSKGPNGASVGRLGFLTVIPIYHWTGH